MNGSFKNGLRFVNSCRILNLSYVYFELSIKDKLKSISFLWRMLLNYVFVCWSDVGRELETE